MGFWGLGLFQSNRDYDIKDELSEEAGIGFYHVTDPAAAATKLNSNHLLSGMLKKRIDRVGTRDGSLYGADLEFVLLVALAMEVGAKISPEHMDHLNNIYMCKPTLLYEKAQRQIRRAIERYPNDGTPYDFESLSLSHTMRLQGDGEEYEMRRCVECHEEDKAKLKKCGKCKKAVYCSRACQETDWRTHRRWCARKFLSPITIFRLPRT